MQNKKMVIDDLTFDEVGLLCTALKTTIIKMKMWIKLRHGEVYLQK